MKKKPINSSKDFLVVGVGGSGCSAVNEIIKSDANLPYLLVDSDFAHMKDLDADKSLLIGGDLTEGLSSGGDAELGRQATEKEAIKIRDLFKLIKLMLIVGGLGGGTASGAIPVLTRIARETGTHVIVLVSLPFVFEGKNRINIAEDSINRMRSHTDIIVRVTNERLKIKSDNQTLKESFKLSHTVISDAVYSLWIMCSRPGICGLDFSSIHTILRHCDGFCHFANIVVGHEEDRISKLSNGLIKHPLMNKGLLWEGAPGAIIFIRGDDQLRLNEVELLMESINAKMPDDAWINFGMQIDSNIKGIHVTALVAASWKKPLVDGMLPLDVSESNTEEIFKEVSRSIYNNEDLDVPTYRRRNIKLPR